MKWMLKNSKGVPDSMLTFAVMGAGTVVGAIIASVLAGSKFVVGSQEIVLHSPDATVVTAFLGATLLAYVNRRNKKDELEHDLKKIELEREKLDA